MTAPRFPATWWPPILSGAVALAGAGIASGLYPGGFDWHYQVMSELASSVHNPAGGRWFAAALAASLAVLWPVTARCPRFGAIALRAGIVFGVLTGLERLLVPDASDLLDRSHEMLAMLSFVCLYVGVVAVCVVQLRTRRHPVTAALLLAWFTALGAMLLYLWLGQRELGWVGREWRALGIPLWRSFAFWQWFACGSVWFAFAVFASWAPLRRSSD